MMRYAGTPLIVLTTISAIVLALTDYEGPDPVAAETFADEPVICPPTAEFVSGYVGYPYYSRYGPSGAVFHFRANPFEVGFPGPDSSIEWMYANGFPRYLTSSDGQAVWSGSPAVLVRCSRYWVFGWVFVQQVIGEQGQVQEGDCDDEIEWAPPLPMRDPCQEGGGGGDNDGTETMAQGSGSADDAEYAAYMYMTEGECTDGWDIYVDGEKVCDAEHGHVN